MLGCFFSFGGCGWWLSFGALGLLPAWGVRLLPLGHWVVALAFVLWRLSFGALGLLLSLPLGGCGCHLSNGPLRLLLMVGVAFCASGLLLLLLLSLSSSSSLPFSFSSSSWFSSSLSVFSGLLPASLAWCLAFPWAWLGRPHLTLLLLLFLVLDLSSIVWGRWWWWRWWRRLRPAAAVVVGVFSPLV